MTTNPSFLARIKVLQVGISGLPSVEFAPKDEAEALRFINMMHRWDRAQKDKGIRTGMFHQCGTTPDRNRYSSEWQQFEFWQQNTMPTMEELLVFEIV